MLLELQACTISTLSGADSALVQRRFHAHSVKSEQAIRQYY